MSEHATVKLGEYTVPLIGVPKDATEERCEGCGRLFHVSSVTFDEEMVQRCTDCKGQRTLAQAAPREFTSGEYHDTPAFRLKERVVVHQHEGGWPGPQKHVHRWWLLADGHRVAWNENPARGWSFPVLPPVKTGPVASMMEFRQRYYPKYG